MSGELPPYYFRVRETGAFVYRVAEDPRRQRIGMDQIAVVNIRNGEVKPHGDRSLSEADLAAIRDWMAERRDLVRARELDDVFRTIDQLNVTAHWAQSRAPDAALEAVTDSLLMAMHDLRGVLVRKRAERLDAQHEE